MRDIRLPGNNENGINSNRPSNIPARNIIPIEQAKRYVAPAPIKRDYFEPRKNNSKKYLALGLFLSLVLISVIFFLATFAFDGATITIKPQIRKDNGLNETYIVSELDKGELMQNKSIAVAESLTIPKRSTKKVFRKAEGDVTIYNNFGKDPVKFVRGTRLSTTDGKLFRTTENIIVPGKAGNEPGQISAHVIADTEGVEYNIGPTKFTIPGLKATPKYKDFYAESVASMFGGASGNVNEVADADLQKAIIDLRAKLIDSAQDQVGVDVPEGFVFNKNTLFLVTGKMKKTSEDDTTATYTQMATATTVFFKRDEIVRRILEKQNTNGIEKPVVKVLDTSKIDIGISGSSGVMATDTQVTLTVTGPAPAIFYPNKQEILEYYAGRPVSEFNDITKKFPFVESAKRVIYPFWNSSFPNNISKITVVFDDSM